MTDTLDATRRSALMKAVPTRNTSVELAVRKVLFKAGYRYRLHRKDLPGSPDIVFPCRRKAVFINGCFWHSHQFCPKGKPPKSRPEFWEAKLSRNRARDAENLAELAALGWLTLTVWQCELKDAEALRRTFLDFLGPVKSDPDALLTNH
jgi:DNA mismatch endonuclease (patch repair protein)